MGAVNGGVWRTTSMGANKQHWEPVTDGQPVRCSSIGALATGAAVGRPEVIVAGCGFSTSSMMGVDWNIGDTGDFGGVMYSLDSGDTWAMANGFPRTTISARSRCCAIARSSSGRRTSAIAMMAVCGAGVWPVHETAFLRVYDKPCTRSLATARPCCCAAVCCLRLCAALGR